MFIVLTFGVFGDQIVWSEYIYDKMEMDFLDPNTLSQKLYMDSDEFDVMDFVQQMKYPWQISDMINYLDENKRIKGGILELLAAIDRDLAIETLTTWCNSIRL